MSVTWLDKLREMKQEKASPVLPTPGRAKKTLYLLFYHMLIVIFPEIFPVSKKLYLRVRKL